ncbi:MAG: synthase subunit delta [Pseudonocardiales bacterium]|jgi:F-type H+-transporting ATPase subunit delta|nr:synthase subunit delta [Pseudonocardiales bacterium]
MMRSASREAMAHLRRRRDEVLGSRASADALTALADDLYAVADLLVGQPRLRRALADPASLPDARAQLVVRLLSGKVGEQASEVVQAAVRERWSSSWDLTDALERAADDALFGAAERAGVIDEVEDELFRFERILSDQSQLTTLLDEIAVDAPRRIALLDQVVGGKVQPITKALLEHAVASQRKRSVTLAIDELLDEAAALRERSVARVLSAVELTAQQQSRLAAALSDLYGRPITIRTAVDPAVRGGLVIRVGDELIDGSVAARLTSARAALAG